MPVRNAEVTKAIILNLPADSPTLSAAMRLSRTAVIARPVRESMRFCTTNSVNNTSAKPTAKVASLVLPVTPIGPLSTFTPPSSIASDCPKLKCQPLLS